MVSASGPEGHFRTVSLLTLALTVALLLPVLFEHGHPWLAFSACAIALIGLVGTRLEFATFAGLSLIQTGYLWGDWQRADNHQYLLLYWYVAMAASARAAGAAREWAVSCNARILVALVMGAAVAQKLLSDEYVSGRFFFLSFLVDERFVALERLLGSLLATARLDNARAVAALLDDPTIGTIELHSGPPALAQFAVALTWISIAVEAAVAVSFALAVRIAAATVPALIALLSFAIGTYTLAPVPGFGALLCLLGFAATHRAQRPLRLAFAIAAAYALCSEGLLAA